MHDSHNGQTNGNLRPQHFEGNGSSNMLNNPTFAPSSLPPSLAALLPSASEANAYHQPIVTVGNMHSVQQPETNVSPPLPNRSSTSPPNNGTYTFVDVQKEGGGVKFNAACAECRKAHKQCSKTFPCTRCIKLGLADTCIQAERKKRLPSKRKWFQVQGDGSAVLIEEEPPSASASSSTTSSNSSSSSDLTTSKNPRGSPPKRGAKKQPQQQPQQQQLQQHNLPPSMSEQQYMILPQNSISQQTSSSQYFSSNTIQSQLAPMIHQLQVNGHQQHGLNFANVASQNVTPPTIQPTPNLSLSNYSLQQPQHMQQRQIHQQQFHQQNYASTQFVNSSPHTLLHRQPETNINNLFQQNTFSNNFVNMDKQHLYQYLSEQQQRNANDFLPNSRESHNS